MGSTTLTGTLIPLLESWFTKTLLKERGVTVEFTATCAVNTAAAAKAVGAVEVAPDGSGAIIVVIMAEPATILVMLTRDADTPVTVATAAMKEV